jgi:DNA (cytosine-5)-methyltransferase 1
MTLTHLSLFSGIGGLDLAAEWAGFETVGQCEWADYPIKILEKHWPDVPRWRDIHDLTREDFERRTGRRTVTVVSGGFPCQPFSVAGKQKGKGDERYLWPQMLRVIRELKPTWVIGENVPGILRLAGRTVCEDLEREGYTVTVFNFEAAAVGAKHRRERVFFVGNSEHNGLSTKQELRGNETASNTWRTKEPPTPGQSEGADRPFNVPSLSRSEYGSQQNVANSESLYVQGQYDRSRQEQFGGSSWWSVEPDVGRVANGIPNRVDRLKCLGNAVVPQQAYPIFKAIAELEGRE